MPNSPLVSIITPVFNRENYLPEMIQSVIGQTYSNWELLLVDDGSDDKSWKIMQNYAAADSRIQALKRPQNRLKGANAARNYGLENSKGRFINWFDSDDKMHPEFIERKVRAFGAKKDLDLVFSKTIRTDFQGMKVWDERLKFSNDFLKDYILRNISWYLPDGMFKKTYLDDKLVFDENLLAGQDRDFYIRLLSHENPSIKILNFYGTFYRIHTCSISEEIYRKGNLKLQYSQYKSLVKQIAILKLDNKLDNDLKKHYALELSKRLPAVIRTNKSIVVFFNQLLQLSRFNLYSITIWCKVMLSYFSFIFFNKGECFLK